MNVTTVFFLAILYFCSTMFHVVIKYEEFTQKSQNVISESVTATDFVLVVGNNSLFLYYALSGKNM